MLLEQKVFKDSVLGYITVDEDLIWNLINTPEFNRLRRIKHLGGVSLVFPSAEHSRFTHSLGVYEITQRMIKSISNLKLSEREKLIVLVSALLHDIGHGPFSHVFEEITNFHHEKMATNIILGDTAINKLLVEAGIADEVALVLTHSHPNKLLSNLISSQIDADRIDYLLRDAYHTGVIYGNLDVEHLFHISKVIDDEICFRKSGVKELELFFLSRSYMYESIYNHKAGRSYEILIKSCLKRYSDIKDHFNFKHNYEYLDGYLNDLTNPSLFWFLDDHTLLHYFKLMMNEEDKILCDLATRIINRQLFDYHTYVDEGLIGNAYEKVVELLENNGFDSNYYLILDKNCVKIYDKRHNIKLFDETNNQYYLDSSILSNVDDNMSVTIYYPSILNEEINKLLNDIL